MLVRRYLTLAILTLSLFTTQAFAQAQQQSAPEATSKAATAAVTASVAGGGVRFTAPDGEALQLRLELYAASGERVFDSGARAGSVLDWQPADVAQGLADGSYLCIVTVKDIQGRAKQRLGSLSLSSGQTSLQRVRNEDVTDAQKQTLAANRRTLSADAADADNAITVLQQGKARAATVTAHDGQDGQVTSTTGALTFRTGDTLAGLDREQVRITPDGRVGIGTNKPEAALDVAGTIRARGGIMFEDGTVLKSAPQSGTNTTTLAAVGGGVTASATGAGTQNRVSKWIDGAGTLGDASFSEISGMTVFGVNASGQNAPLFPTAPNLHVVEIGAPGTKTPLVLAGGSGSMEFWKDRGSIATGEPSAAVAFGMATPGLAATNDLIFSTYLAGQPWNERLRIGTNGNIGIGTPAPQAKLEVAGSVKLSGAGSALIFPDGSSMTTASAGGGGGTPSGTSIVNAINDPATIGVIGDNRHSANMARLNGANAWSGANVFGAGLSANNSLVTNVGNPVNAGDATNKAYVDANFIRFVPGAEQLSVGDANGTAPMINLRGGSTCCSGPGGHTPAFFKVFQNGSFVATGNLGIGVSPLEGKGYRTSWHTYKGAFRSGYADNEWDDANTGFFSWAGGSNSTASGLYALAFGDTNFAESTSSIVFGSGNQVKGAAGFSAGAGNRVCDTYGVALGNKAQSGGPLINGKCDPDSFNLRGLAAIALGYNVTADQDHTTAMGKFATNNGFSGTFIWSDGSATASADTFRNTANNEFAARATGGFRFRTNLTGTTGCNLPAGSGVFNCTSSRYTKQNFLAVNGEDVLARLRNVPVTTWNYISEGAQSKHMGPMAEDFYQAFGLGTGNTSIGVQDLVGVSLAAVKSLDERTAQLQQRTLEVEQLRTEVQQLRAANATMEQRLVALEQSMKQQPESPRR
jgi:hypothetical protein